MIRTFRRASLALLACLGAVPALADTHLRVGLADDPDILDPTLARSYTARIVFASLCDKLFDIDEKLNIVPQLALGHETACHFWRDIAPPPQVAASAAANRRLERLQSAFHTPGRPGMVSP